MKNRELMEFLQNKDPEAEIEISVSAFGETKKLTLAEHRLIVHEAAILINAEYW